MPQSVEANTSEQRARKRAKVRTEEDDKGDENKEEGVLESRTVHALEERREEGEDDAMKGHQDGST